MSADLGLIRNFAIIAHIDHGKSTLADRLIQHCGGLSEREMVAQVLDSLELERERGITIKAQSVRLNYRAKDGHNYQLNMIDTPGHVDFSYEVSRSLAACEAALLVVDVTQGVEAQTVSVCRMALAQGLPLIPVLNKIDLSQAEPERVVEEIEEMLEMPVTTVLEVSAKHGWGVAELLEEVVASVPPPQGDSRAPLQALIIDSWFDNYLGVVSLVKVQQGEMRVGDKINVMSTYKNHVIDKLGYFSPKPHELALLAVGEVGYVVAGIKEIQGAPVGDTLTLTHRMATVPLPGFDRVKPRVYASLFPISSDDYPALRDALGKLSLNDASLSYEQESSQALGFGFRCGFLGMLHLEIVQQRLQREYQLTLLATAPTVIYQLELTNGKVISIDNPSHFPNVSTIKVIQEAIVSATILVPPEYVGAVMTLCVEKRGVQQQIRYLSNQVSLHYELPLSEVVLDFFDRLKSLTRGYASLDYQFSHFQEADLVKLDILINGDLVEAFSTVVHREHSYRHGRLLVERLRKLIPRQLFDIAIQAAIGNHVIARETVKALRKNVTAKCYGGDVSRKKKLLEKQKAGKKKMKQIGKVSIPHDAFLAVFKKQVDRANDEEN